MRRTRRELVLFLVPSVLVLGVVLLYPLGYSLWLSLFSFYLPRPPATFVGLANYTALFAEHRFWVALWNTLQIVVGGVALQFVLGLALALALTRFTRGAQLFNVLLFLPQIITPVVAGLLLKWMFMYKWGLIHQGLTALGLPAPDWLGHPLFATWAVILADTWQHMPFITLVLYAGLQSLPADPIEAALVDGASGFRLLWHILLPSLRPLILFVLTIRTMDAFRLFDLIFVITGGGPGTATETVTYYNYILAFRLLQIGKASALGVVTLVLLSVILGGLILLVYRRERGEW
jgi:multiple sugar transport system permease protein